MAEFSSFVITAKGQALMAKLIASSGTCNFSAIKTSTTVYTQGQLEALTALTNIKQSAEISSINRINNVSVNIKGALNNTALVTGYTVNAIGLYAIDPNEGEILYAVARATQAGYMPPYNSITSSGILFDFVITVGNASNVTVTVNPAAVATQADVIAINAEIADLAGYVGYTDDDIVGVEVDYANKKFTRLAGAVGKTPGADFNNILAFGGRRKCNLSDLGVVNAYYGEPGYIEDGSNGQVMVEQPKFYYKVVPLKMEKNDEVEIVSIVFTAATTSGNITIKLNGTDYNVAVVAGDDAAAVATKVRNTAFAGWTTGGSSATVSFTATKVGAKAATTFTDTGTTGVTGTITRTQCGYIGKGFKLRKARYYISMTKKAGFKVHPAFVKNNVEKEKIYLSAYEGCAYDVSASAFIFDDTQTVDFTATSGDKLSSRASVKPISGNTQDLTRRKCGIIAENRGTGWSQQYAATAACTQLLFTVEYASMNSQTAIGMGVVNKPYVANQNDSELTGSTTNLGNASGMAAGTNGLVSVTYRGEENFWGNIWKFTDGMNIFCDIANSIHDVFIADNAFAESTQASPYANAGITLATRNGYVSAMAYSETYDWLFVPAETLGDTALPVGDYFYQTAASNGYKIALLGGPWHDGLHIGAFCWAVDAAPSVRSRTIGGRLVYVPAA